MPQDPATVNRNLGNNVETATRAKMVRNARLQLDAFARELAPCVAIRALNDVRTSDAMRGLGYDGDGALLAVPADLLAGAGAEYDAEWYAALARVDRDLKAVKRSILRLERIVAGS